MCDRTETAVETVSYEGRIVELTFRVHGNCDLRPCETCGKYAHGFVWKELAEAKFLDTGDLDTDAQWAALHEEYDEGSNPVVCLDNHFCHSEMQCTDLCVEHGDILDIVKKLLS